MRKASKSNRRKPLFILSKQLFFTTPPSDLNVVCIDSACQQGRNKNIDKITIFLRYGILRPRSCKWKSFICVQLFATPWTIQSMEFSRPEYWILHQGILPTQGSKPRSSTLQVGSLPAEPPGKPKNTGVGSSSLLQQIFQTKESNHGLLPCRWILYQLSYLGLCGSSKTMENLKEMWISDYLTWLLGNLYTNQEETVRTGHRTPDWFQIGKEVRQGCILSPCLFNLYAEYIMSKTRLDEA